MLTLTDSATSAIRELTSQPDVPDQAGLRIMTQGEGASTFQLALTEGPGAGDQVVENEGVRVFVEAAAAEVLTDKSLDAQLGTEGDVIFRIADQASPA